MSKEVTKRINYDKEEIGHVQANNFSSTFFKTYSIGRKKMVWKTWLVLLIEFIGTFLLTFLIIAPSVFGLYALESENFSGSAATFVEIFTKIFQPMFMRALWVGAGIWILIIWFNKISMNFNPVVTFAEMGAGNIDNSQGVLKIFIQVIAAILASAFAYLIANAAGIDVESLDSIRLGVHNSYLLGADDNVFSYGTNMVVNPDTGFVRIWYALLQFTLEFILTFGLLAVIFLTEKISIGPRSFIISIGIVILVSIGIRTNNIAINPARLLGPAIVATFINLTTPSSTIDSGAWQAIPLILSAEILAGYLMYYIVSTKNDKKVNNEISTIKQQEKNFWAKILTLEILLEETKTDHKSIYLMSSEELRKKAKTLGVAHIKEFDYDQLQTEVIIRLVEDHLDESLAFNTEIIAREEELLAKKIRERGTSELNSNSQDPDYLNLIKPKNKAIEKPVEKKPIPKKVVKQPIKKIVISTPDVKKIKIETKNAENKTVKPIKRIKPIGETKGKTNEQLAKELTIAQLRHLLFRNKVAYKRSASKKVDLIKLARKENLIE
ncbi:MAG: hypothetical protein GQ557_01065 [Mycoplasmataceae bacterium]|nr:hypothetical protein [Mycoplasmataceae bacterium]